MPVRYSDQGSIREAYIASQAGLTWKMMAFSLSCTARSRMASNSAFCSAVLSAFREGQSMFPTVATQAARNSLSGAGGTTREGS